MDSLSQYRELANEVFTNGTLYITKMNQYSEGFIDNCEKFYHTKSTLYYETINRPERILQKRLEDIQKRKADLIRIKSSMLNTLESLENTSTAVLNGSIVRIETITRKTYEYFRLGNRTKLSVSYLFHSENFITDLSQIRQFLQEIATRGAFLFDTWMTMAVTAKHIWGDVINDRDLLEYYVYKNYTDFLRNATQVKDEIDTDFRRVRSENDMRFVVGNTDTLFLDAVSEVQIELMEFNKSTTFDEKVLKYDINSEWLHYTRFIDLMFSNDIDRIQPAINGYNQVIKSLFL